MLPYISNCVIQVTLSDLVTLLSEANPLNTSLSSETQSNIESFGTMSKGIYISVQIILYIMYYIGPALFVYTPSTDQLTNEM